MFKKVFGQIHEQYYDSFAQLNPKQKHCLPQNRDFVAKKQPYLQAVIISAHTGGQVAGYFLYEKHWLSLDAKNGISGKALLRL